MTTNHNSKHKRKDGFEVPEGYFESFDARFFKRLDGNVKHPKRIVQFTLKKKIISIAAAAALFIGLGLFFKTQTTSSLSNEALENYFEYNPSYTLSNEFIQTLDESDLQELEQTIHVNQKDINEYVQTNIDLDYYLNY